MKREAAQKRERRVAVLSSDELELDHAEKFRIHRTEASFKEK